jgi:hypothetical protein
MRSLSDDRAYMRGERRGNVYWPTEAPTRPPLWPTGHWRKSMSAALALSRYRYVLQPSGISVREREWAWNDVVASELVTRRNYDRSALKEPSAKPRAPLCHGRRLVPAQRASAASRGSVAETKIQSSSVRS